MKLNKKLMALASATALSLSGQAFAAGTASGVTITNTVTLDFTVASTPQTQLSTAADITVDNKVILTLTSQDGGLVSVAPNQTQAAFKFLLTNTGNTTQDYLLTSGEVANGVDVLGNADSDDTTASYSYYLSDGDTAFEPGAGDALISGNKIEDIAADGGQEFWAVATIPADAVDGGIIGLEVKAQAADATTGVALTETSGDKNADLDGAAFIVFAEDTSDSSLTLGSSTRDGARAALAGAQVVAANLQFSKTATVLSDPINGSTNPRAIPGAIIEYTIEVENAGSTAATAITIADDVNAIAGLLDDSVTNIAITFSPGTETDNSGISGIDVDVPTLTATDGTAGSGDDYIKIVFRATVE